MKRFSPTLLPFTAIPFSTILSLFFFTLLLPAVSNAQPLSKKNIFTAQDTLRGSNGAGRAWWDVVHYDLHVNVNIDQQFISGYNEITYKIVQPNKKALMQIDLQQPMQIEKIECIVAQGPQGVPFSREGNVVWITLPQQKKTAEDTTGKIKIYFKGHPKAAATPPWDGGWIWRKDALDRPFVSVACQGLGASVWYPCKDYQADEPDYGATVTLTVPDSLVAVGNGRLTQKISNNNGSMSWQWTVTNPINNYLIIPYIGHYINFTDTVQGAKGTLQLSYWVLDYNAAKAKNHFSIVKPMLRCFEDWMGPYPFYEDSYKLVEAPHLGMEHQSAIAYGNNYKNGYMGSDRSGTGWGNDWDFIIVHESGHEWFANNITTKDIADMWVHESFTTYSESFFVQCKHGLAAANAYVQGQRKNIHNDVPVIGPYGVNQEGSSDMYDKGATMLHMIRQIMNDDDLFKKMIRGLNADFYHQTVTTAQIEHYINIKSGKNFSKVFDQYLRTTQIPTLEYKVTGNTIRYRWIQCVPGFNMPVKLTNGVWLYPSAQKFKTITISAAGSPVWKADANFYVSIVKTTKG